MSIVSKPPHAVSSYSEIEANISALKNGASKLTRMTVSRRLQLLHACIEGVCDQAENWIEASCDAKRISPNSNACSEEILSGPLPTLRYLRLLSCSLQDIDKHGKPKFRSAPYQKTGRWRIPVFPTSQLFDALLFLGMRAETWLRKETDKQNLFGPNIDLAIGKSEHSPKVTLVLGAGNISSIPATDTLSKLFQTSQAVLLKMNPVNEYLGPIFEKAFATLIEEDLLRIVYGGAETGAQLVQHDAVADIHITGSEKTHDNIVWGQTPEEQCINKSLNKPVLDKKITSELGNVSPWIIVPGKYSDRQMYFQAENIVASITQNASFNCIATKMLVTWRQWPQREKFLNQIESVLASIKPRYAYYPGAAERFERYSGQILKDDDSNYLPWTLLRDIDPDKQPHLFQEESFVCVCAETAIDADSQEEFCSKATKFVNEKLWGTLSAALMVPQELQHRNPDALDQMIEGLRYGMIGVNQWPAVSFALMSPPWGGHPDTTLKDVQSGVGFVHNTYLLEGIEKTVLSSSLTIWPKPMWFSTHRCPKRLAQKLLEYYKKPTLAHLLPVFYHALRG